MHFYIVKLEGKLTLKELTFIDFPMLEIPSQTEIKLNRLPVAPFLVYMHGTRLTFGKPLSENNVTSRYFLIVSAKSVEVPIELSEDSY